MTQEQRVNRGTIIIFILSIVLLLCLCVTTMLAYFAGKQTSNTTLILGGPVRVSIIDNNNNDTYGEGNLVMNIKNNREFLLPGIGIDVQAIAKVSSSEKNPTYALLRAILDVDVTGLNEQQAKEVEDMIRYELGRSLTQRIDASKPGATDGWLQHTDGNYYYCSQTKKIDEETGEELIVLASIPTNEKGMGVPFINGTLQFPTKPYTNEYANIEITFTLRFQAIQEKLVNEEYKEVNNTMENVGYILDNLDWSTHND